MGLVGTTQVLTLPVDTQWIATMIHQMPISAPVAVTAEELGDVPAGPLCGLDGARGLGTPAYSGGCPAHHPEAQQNARLLIHAGVQIRILTPPYLHAKLIVKAHHTWVGSQNWSEASMQQDREVGVITRNSIFSSLTIAVIAHPLRLMKEAVIKFGKADRPTQYAGHVFGPIRDRRAK